MLNDLFLALFLISLAALFFGMIRPSFVKTDSRKKVLKIFGGAIVLFFILFVATISPKNISDQSSDSATTPIRVSQNIIPSASPTILPASQNTSGVTIPSQKETSTPVSSPQPTVTLTAFPTVQTPSAPQFKDGNYVVGTDIKPGTYRTREESSGCYYSRLSGFGGSLSEIISNDNTYAPAIITILATDKGFVSTNCGIWTQDLSSITTSQISFSDGVFIIGTDIKPGTYRSTGSEGCYYSRLRGFSGTLSDIISNKNTNTSDIVTIAASDKGFKSSHCGTWSKIQ